MIIERLVTRTERTEVCDSTNCRGTQLLLRICEGCGGIFCTSCRHVEQGYGNKHWCFPCWHVDATDCPRESLRKELNEELGLDDRTDLMEVNEIATYNIAIPDFQPNYAEIEHTTLYRATIRPESVSRFRLQEGEVGGLVLFKLDELDRWIKESPDRVGGGLIDSWKYYSGP